MKKGRIIFSVACFTCFSLFFYGAHGQQLSSPVEGVSDSVVEFLAINQDNSKGEILTRGTGFFLENSREDYVTVVAELNFFNTLFFLKQSVTFEMRYKGEPFNLYGAEISPVPLQNLIFIHLPKDKFDMGPSVKPLQIRDAPLEGSELLFIDGFPIGPFERVGAIDIKYHKDWDTWAFMMDRTNMVGATGAPLVDKNDKLVSILMRSYFNYGYGFKDVTELNELMKAESCTTPLTDCILEAGRKLYEAAKGGDAKSQLFLLQIEHMCKGCFENFLRSIQVLSDSTQVKTILDDFKKQASQSYLALLYLRIRGWGPPTERPEEEYFWETGIQLAEEEGYSDVRYMLCDLLDRGFEGGSPGDNLDCFLGSARQGFSQSQWAAGVGLHEFDTITSLDWFGSSARQGHFESCKVITKVYNLRGEACQHGGLGIMYTKEECNELIRWYDSVKDTCENELNFPLASDISMHESIFFPRVILLDMENLQ